MLQVSPQRQDRVVSNPPLGQWSNQDGAGEWITTHEAAQLLGCGVRTVQRLAPAFGTRRGRRWVLSHSAVLAHKNLREQEQDDRAAAA
jgi:excisionase family DNA binding protein